MTERESSGAKGGDGGVVKHQQSSDGPQKRNNNTNAYKPPKFGKAKPGKDRRISLRSKDFDKNYIKKMEGEEIPLTRRVSKLMKIIDRLSDENLCFTE